MEKKVLAAIVQNKSSFDKIYPHVKPSDFSDQGNIILKHVAAYYENDPAATHVDTDLLMSRIERELLNPKHVNLFSGIIKSLPADVSAANVAEDFIQMRRDKVAEKLGTALLAHQKGPEVGSMMDEYLSLSTDDLDEEEDEYHNFSISDLVSSHMASDKLIPVFPGSLSKRLDGGLMRGSHVVVYGRPNSFKSGFCINAAACYIRRNYKVLYIINEDPTPAILLRIVNNLTKMPKYDIVDNPDKAQELADAAGYKNLVLRGLAPGTFREIRSLIEEHEPDIVFIDQLRNVYTNAENRTNQLERAATEARNLAKKYNIVVYSVTQAGDSASGKAVLDMGDVDGSNTGIPAQADLLIGVGVTENLEQQGFRMLTIAKNKINECHEHFTIQVIPNLSKVVSVE